MRTLLFDASRDSPTQWERLDWQLLMNSHVHRVEAAGDLNLLHGQLSDLGYLTRAADAGEWSSASQMHDELSMTFDFPDYYGRNLDALADVMRDVAMYERGSDPATTGTALLLAGFEGFAKRESKAAHALLEIFALAARMAMVVGHPMVCVVQSPIWHAAVGSTPVMPVHPGWLR